MPAFTATFRALSAAVARACGVERPPEPTGPVDWDAFLGLVDRHGVAGLAARGGVEAAPAEVRAALEARRKHQALASLHISALQRRVLATLREAGVRGVVVKGLALGAEAHGDSAARGAGDVDLLIDRDSVVRAVSALRESGLGWYGWQPPVDPDTPPLAASALYHLEHLPMLRDVTLTSASGVLVELHWRLFENPHLMRVDPAWLARPYTVEIHGDDVATLPPAAHLAYALVHGTRHWWSMLKWLADVPALMLRRGELAEVGSLRAAAPGNDRAVATGLLVAESAFGQFLPPASRAWAEAVPGTGALIRRSLSTLAAPLAPPRVIAPRALASEVATRMTLRPDAAYRRAELRLALLGAGRAHGVPDPGPRQLIAGPTRWARRTLRRRRWR